MSFRIPNPVLSGTTWRNNDGVELQPNQFDNDYLLNTIAFIQRRKLSFLGAQSDYDLWIECDNEWDSTPRPSRAMQLHARWMRRDEFTDDGRAVLDTEITEWINSRPLVKALGAEVGRRVLDGRLVATVAPIPPVMPTADNDTPEFD